MAEALLQVQALHAWYGESHILHGVDLEVRKGEVVTLLGRNGAGKTTTLKSVMGMVGRREGSITFEGRPRTLVAKLMAPLFWLMRGTMRKCLAEDLRDLKAAAERRGPTPGPR